MPTSEDFAALRLEYSQGALDESSVARHPIDQFTVWFDQALRSNLPEPNAMSLATVDHSGRPNCRMVLLKGFSAGGFVFFTNYDSMKGTELIRLPWATLVFHWHGLERQVRILGRVERVSEEESDAYFRSRPYRSQLGAFVSPQSQVVPDRAWLEQRFRDAEEQFPEGSVPRPKNWGGFRIEPVTLEFWQGRRSRLHDRILYTREGQDWRLERLAP